MKDRIPPAYRESYEAHRTRLAKSRVPVLGATASMIFYIVSAQYMLREKITGKDTFDPREFIVWVALAAGLVFIRWVHSRSKTFGEYRRNAFAFNILFMACLTALGLIYPNNATVFAFYYALTLVLTSVVVPWPVRDVMALSAATLGYFTFYYFFVRYGMRIDGPVFPRFHPFIDGVIFILIAQTIAVVVRRKQSEHDAEHFVLSRIIEEKNARIETELQMAAKVHATLVPPPVKTANADIAVTYIPVGHVGGDYAMYRFQDEHRLIVFISDVSGHGVPAALLANRVHAEFERAVAEGKSPGFILGELSRFLTNDFEDSGMFMSAFCALVDFETEKLIYASYGHPDQFLYRASNGAIHKMSSTAGLLGGPWQPSESDAERMISFDRGDAMLFFTDGVVETMNPNGELYGDDRLGSLLHGQRAIGADEFNLGLIEELKTHAQADFKDDIFLIHVKTKLCPDRLPEEIVRTESNPASSRIDRRISSLS